MPDTVPQPWPSAPPVRREMHHGRPVLTYAERPPSFNAAVWRSVQAFPDRTALIFEGERWSYLDLWQEARSFAATAHGDYGISPGERIAVLTGNLPEFVIAALGTALLGAILVPLNTRLLPHELLFMLEDSGSRLLVTTSEQWEPLAGVREQLPALQGIMLTGETRTSEATRGTRPWHECLRGGTPPAISVSEEQPLYLCYTSGTTGLPKGAVCTHLNLVHTLLNYELVKGLRADDRTLLGVPIFHITGLAAQFAQFLYQGGTIVLQRLPFRAGPALELIERERVTHFFGVPTMYLMLMNHADFVRRDISSLRLAASGGAPLPPDVVRRWSQQAPQVQFLNFYGLTETTSPATCLPDRYKLERPGSAGLPLPVTEVRVVDEHHATLPAESVGELAIRGPMVFKEYWRNPQATQAAFFEDGWFLTGDLARLDSAGFLQIADRKKDMINRAGEKVYCVEVEHILYSHPAILEAAIVGVPDGFYGEIVKAIIVPRPGQTIDPDEVRTFVSRRLAAFKVPALIEVRDTLPRNPGGKVMKQLLRGG
jgi:long-chain acyl-CoA synthetase